MSVLKKFVILLVLCAVVSLSNFQIASAYPEPVAVISNYKKVKNGISIQRASGPARGSKALLYPGDKITGDVGYITIECGPYANFHNVKNQYYLITYDPPSWIDGLVDNLYDVMRVFWKKANVILAQNGEKRINLMTRGAESNLESYGIDLNPRPGFSATLLKDQKIIFAGVGETDSFGKTIAPKNYVVKDSHGQEIYNGSFDKDGKAELNVTSQNFKAGEKYTWVVDDSAEYDFTILDEETTKKIHEYFAEIDAKKTSEEERTLEKAFWAQYVSDTSDGKINLYWLSAQLLTSISPKSDDARQEKYTMLQKYHEHLMEEFNAYISAED